MIDKKLLKEINDILGEEYTKSYILSKLKKKENMRRILFAIVKKTPAILHEIQEITNLGKQTCYNNLYALVGMKLIDKVPVSGCKEKDIVEKFNAWSIKMPQATKQRYYGVTNFWRLNKCGESFIPEVIQFEKNQKVRIISKELLEKESELNKDKIENEKKLRLIFKDISKEIQDNKIVDKEKRKEVFDKHIKDNPKFKLQISNKFKDEAYHSLLDTVTKEEEK